MGEKKSVSFTRAELRREKQRDTAWRPSADARHLVRGTLYEVYGPANVQAAKLIREGDRVMVYRDASGEAWVRPVDEFNDGRFEVEPRAAEPRLSTELGPSKNNSAPAEARAALKPDDRGELLRRAYDWINRKLGGLHAEGGGDLLAALDAALREPQPQAPSAPADAVVEELAAIKARLRSEDFIKRYMLLGPQSLAEIANRLDAAIAALRSRRKT